MICYFNPRSPWGERRDDDPQLTGSVLFQSTLPVGGATREQIGANKSGLISIHAPRGGSDKCSTAQWRNKEISIHAPRGGSDRRLSRQKGTTTYFNPRSPWGERRFYHLPIFAEPLFQSTLPVGGATADRKQQGYRSDISIHAPRGGSD